MADELGLVKRHKNTVIIHIDPEKDLDAILSCIEHLGVDMAIRMEKPVRNQRWKMLIWRGSGVTKQIMFKGDGRDRIALAMSARTEIKKQLGVR